ncbi:MAG: hypothetical protein KJZ57_09840 [Anaerolineales bacterium]|nr:hypothetical protein [Anaerolineales bacterium]WKZ54503.1 MAG: hypothetical protein QY324_00455 [Anaerolineales bacterium]
MTRVTGNFILNPVNYGRNLEAEMAYRAWQVEKIEYCENAGREVTLETEMAYPADHLPDQPPRVIAHRCSNAEVCNLLDKAACKWCGTNPDYSPL